jgi:predicted cupin superfamily sugar epimerase
MHTARYWIQHLQLQQHIEGGWYKEVYKASQTITLPGSNREKTAATHIYFLLQQQEFSALHRIAADELWHFYAGTALTVYEITISGELIKHTLGNNPANNETHFCVIKAGSWFGAKTTGEGDYALVGCTVAPGFDFADFELAERSEMLNIYPQHEEVIEKLTR